MAVAKSAGPIQISAPTFEILHIKIRGTAPLVINRFSHKAMEKMQRDQEAGSAAKSRKVREAKDFEACFQEAKHVSEEGWEGIHAAAFRNGAIDACRAAGVVMTRAKLAFMVEADGFDRVDGAPLVRIIKGEAEQWIAPTRNKTGVVDLRSRPMYREWEALLRVRYDTGMLARADMLNLLARVGMQVGIGEGRPYSKESGGLGFGLFTLVND